MHDMEVRLIRCFQTVFPNLTEDMIPSSSQETVANWDSIAAITLVSVIEEEFGVEMDLDDIAELDSFGSIQEYLQSRMRV
jgi:acyl carrier protein